MVCRVRRSEKLARSVASNVSSILPAPSIPTIAARYGRDVLLRHQGAHPGDRGKCDAGDGWHRRVLLCDRPCHIGITLRVDTLAGFCTSPRPSFPKAMFAAALRPTSLAARAALRPARTAAVRAISSTAARRSDVPTPQIFGEGAKPGQVPTDENQSTGLERLQVLGAIEGVEVFDLKPLDSSRIGTLADPVKVFSSVSSLHL